MSVSARRTGTPQARGAIFGLTRNSGPAEIAQAALEAVGYQTRDLLEAMRADWPAAADTVLRVDGGMTASDVTMQFLADILGAPVDRPMVMETTALGAAYLAGYQAGICPDPDGFAADLAARPPLQAARWMPRPARRKWAGWQAAVARVRARRPDIRQRSRCGKRRLSAAGSRRRQSEHAPIGPSNCTGWRRGDMIGPWIRR